MFAYILSTLLILQYAFASISFTSLSIGSVTTKSPLSPWNVTLEFAGTEGTTSGKVFNLTLPNVYRVEFENITTTTLVGYYKKAEVFKCVAVQGAYVQSDSVLSCTTTSGIENFNAITGSIQFYVYFGVGGSTTSAEISDSKAWSTGENTVTWGDLSTTVEFVETSNDGLFLSSHTTGYDSQEHYFLFPKCDTTQSGNIMVQFNTDSTIGDIDCSKAQVYISNDFNSFLFPKTYSSDYIISSCSDNEIDVYITDLPAGYRVWLTVWQEQTDFTKNIKNYINYDLTCGSEELTKDLQETVVVESKP